MRTRHVTNMLLAAAGVAASFAVAANSGPDPVVDAWRFDVLLDDRPIGIHAFKVRDTGRSREVRIDADFNVTFLRIPVYTYRHRNLERWTDGCLASLESRTDDNGDLTAVSASDRGDVVVIETDNDSRTIDDDCVMSFAYWDRDIVRQNALLNAHTGELMAVAVERVSPTPPDDRFDADALDAYVITSTTDDAVHIEIAYASDSGRWMYLESRLDRGRTLRYLPHDPSSTHPASPLAGDGRRS